MENLVKGHHQYNLFQTKWGT